ncbi:CatB-related O-acetyltransferase [Candidatus Atribacteria bacterium MT.SAG.1]|nr:CatB-related O-acetyltransferase [Candidatus Atribacteria bacterium MT.SAG.1]
MSIFSRINYFTSLYYFKKKWRKLNMHNLTSAKNVFPPEIVSVGKHTYGSLEVYTWGESEQRLEIGSYVSIASGVKFILGGNHRMNTFSTFPFKVKFCGERVEFLSKGKIVIEDDVWIGTDVLILSGAHIGKGAVIGARAVVSGKIPAYAIVVGNPGKIIKYRFDEKIIDKLENVDFNKIDEKLLKDNVDLLYKPLTKDNLEEIFKKLKINI